MSIPDRAEAYDRSIRNWLLGIMRFAVTLDEADRHAILAMAQEMDGLGHLPGRASFRFFTRQSLAACGAIADRADPGRNPILRSLVGSIADRRLRAVMITALALDSEHPPIRQDRRQVPA